MQNLVLNKALLMLKREKAEPKGKTLVFLFYGDNKPLRERLPLRRKGPLLKGSFR